MMLSYGKLEVRVYGGETSESRLGIRATEIMKALPGSEFWPLLCGFELDFMYQKLQFTVVAADSFGNDLRSCKQRLSEWLDALIPRTGKRLNFSISALIQD